jgi:hypothetical protein
VRRGAVAAALVGAALVLSGCQYLLGPLAGGPIVPGDPGAFGSFDPGDFGSFDPGNPMLRPPAATYTMGSASVAMGGTPIALDHLSVPAFLREDIGSNAVWTDGKGNYLQVFGEKAGVTSAGAFVSIDRIADGKHLTATDVDHCKVTVVMANKTGFSGSASCKGMRWNDAMTPFDRVGNPVFLENPPAFDAEITFEAKP